MARAIVDAQTIIGGEHWAIRNGVVLIETLPVSRRELLALPRDGAVWTWLRAHGVRRPSPSGSRQSDRRREADRGARIRLSEDDAEALRELARDRGETLGETVGALVRQENAAKTRR